MGAASLCGFKTGGIQTRVYPEHHLLAQKSLTRRLLLLRKQSGITKRAVYSLQKHFIKYSGFLNLITEERS